MTGGSPAKATGARQGESVRFLIMGAVDQTGKGGEVPLEVYDERIHGPIDPEFLKAPLDPNVAPTKMPKLGNLVTSSAVVWAQSLQSAIPRFSGSD